MPPIVSQANHIVNVYIQESKPPWDSCVAKAWVVLFFGVLLVFKGEDIYVIC